MARLKLSERNPDYLKPDGTLLYSRPERIKIWQAKLLAEFFSTRKPTHTQSFQIRAASLLLVDLSEDFTRARALEPLPKNEKNFWARFGLLQRILAGFKGKKAPGRRKVSSQTPAQDSGGLGLAEILGDEK